MALACLHRAHRPSSSWIWSRSKPAFSSSRMSMPVCSADSSRRPCAGTVIVVPGPRKRRWLVARRGSSSKSWVSNQSDQRALREGHRSGACHGCAPRPANRGRRRMPPRRSRPSPPAPTDCTPTETVAASSTVLVTSRSQSVLPDRRARPVDAAPAARPSHAAARRRRRRNRAHRGERDGVGLNLDPASHRPALGPIGGGSGWPPARGPIRGRAGNPLCYSERPAGGTRARP